MTILLAASIKASFTSKTSACVLSNNSNIFHTYVSLISEDFHAWSKMRVYRQGGRMGMESGSEQFGEDFTRMRARCVVAKAEQGGAWIHGGGTSWRVRSHEGWRIHAVGWLMVRYQSAVRWRGRVPVGMAWHRDPDTSRLRRASSQASRQWRQCDVGFTPKDWSIKYMYYG